MTDNLSSLSQNIMNFRCPYCPKKFQTDVEVNSHVDPCVKSRPYPCVNCSRRFKSAQNLNQHERIHTNVRPYNCQHCEKNFTQKSHLQQHERTHTGETAYLCRYCGERFNIYSSKTQHEKSICGLRETVNNQNGSSNDTSIFVKIVRERSPINTSHRGKWPPNCKVGSSTSDQNEPIQTIVMGSGTDYGNNTRQQYAQQIVIPNR